VLNRAESGSTERAAAAGILPMTPKPTQRRTVFLVSPYGQMGGGMGRIMTYLASTQADSLDSFRLVKLESRGGGRLLWAPFFLGWAMLRIVAEAARGHLAVVHVNLAERGSIYRKGAILFLAKLVGAKVLLHLHAAQLIESYKTTGRLGRAALRGMFACADRSLVLGTLWREWAIRTLGARPQRITVLRNSVPENTLPRVPREAGAPFRLLFLGNLVERKGVTDLLHALALPETQGLHLRLTLAGGGGVESYRAMAGGLGISAKVRFTGWVDQDAARRLLAESDALVLPSHDEGLPLVVLEALGSHVPVICSPVGAIPEVLRDGDTALLVPSGDRPALASAIRRLAADDALAAGLATRGAALYKREFTMRRFAENIGEIYLSLDRPPASTVPLVPATEIGDER
jgi:glycosyltransferase involved in cell wall biosynthesis